MKRENARDSSIDAIDRVLRDCPRGVTIRHERGSSPDRIELYWVGTQETYDEVAPKMAVLRRALEQADAVAGVAVREYGEGAGAGYSGEPRIGEQWTIRVGAGAPSAAEERPKGDGTVREIRRPFRPVDPSEPTAPAFALRPLIERLRGESAFREHGRDAVTLVHRPDLTAVLSVVAEGRTIDENRRVPGPTLAVVLDGAFELRRDGQDSVVLEADTVATVAPEVDHVLVAKRDSAILLVIGAQW